MRAVDVIRKKRDGQVLTGPELSAFVRATTTGEWAPYQVSALLMAIVLRGMTDAETAELTRAMADSGVRLDWSDLPGVPVDKHSTGGVGDKTSLVLAPLAACCGVRVPMMSGRGLGHTGGTLDKLAAIPGFRVDLSLAEMRAALAEVGCVMLSPTEQIAPADRVLYHLRDVTGTVESLPLLASSIMSKKIAEGIRGLVMDVKIGRGAFLPPLDEARRLARTLLAIGAANGVRTRALLTDMDHPLGAMVGNALEVRECVDVLAGGGPDDVRELSVQLAARMVLLGGAAATIEEAEVRVRDALTSGRGLERFRAMVARQGGDPRIVDDPTRLPEAPHREVIRADRSGIAAGWDAAAVGWATVVLGAGRDRADDAIDPAVGIRVLVRPGDAVRPGDGLLEIYYRDPQRLLQATERLAGGCPIVDAPPPPRPLILEELI